MFTQIIVTTSTDDQGNQFASIHRYDNGSKHTGMGKQYRTGNTERIFAVIRGMGFHFMHRTHNGFTFGKLLA